MHELFVWGFYTYSNFYIFFRMTLFQRETWGDSKETNEHRHAFESILNVYKAPCNLYLDCKDSKVHFTM